MLVECSLKGDIKPDIYAHCTSLFGICQSDLSTKHRLLARCHILCLMPEPLQGRHPLSPIDMPAIDIVVFLFGGPPPVLVP